MPVPPEDFERAVDLLLRLVEQGACHVVVLVPRGRQYIQFVYNPNHEPVPSALQEASISRPDLSRAADDITEVLTAATEDIDEAVFVRVRSNPERPRAKPEPEEDARRKLALVKDRFDISDLRRRAWIKRTSKSRLPVAIAWEVNSKLADDEQGSPAGGPLAYGTIVLRTASAGLPFLLDENEDQAVDLDRQDVEVLIASLQRLHGALIEAEQAGDTT